MSRIRPVVDGHRFLDDARIVRESRILIQLRRGAEVPFRFGYLLQGGVLVPVELHNAWAGVRIDPSRTFYAIGAPVHLIAVGTESYFALPLAMSAMSLETDSCWPRGMTLLQRGGTASAGPTAILVWTRRRAMRPRGPSGQRMDDEPVPLSLKDAGQDVDLLPVPAEETPLIDGLLPSSQQTNQPHHESLTGQGEGSSRIALRWPPCASDGMAPSARWGLARSQDHPQSRGLSQRAPVSAYGSCTTRYTDRGGPASQPGVHASPSWGLGETLKVQVRDVTQRELKTLRRPFRNALRIGPGQDPYGSHTSPVGTRLLIHIAAATPWSPG